MVFFFSKCKEENQEDDQGSKDAVPSSKGVVVVVAGVLAGVALVAR